MLLVIEDFYYRNIKNVVVVGKGENEILQVSEEGSSDLLKIFEKTVTIKKTHIIETRDRL